MFKEKNSLVNQIVFYSIELLYLCILSIYIIQVTENLAGTNIYQTNVVYIVIGLLVISTWLFGPLLNRFTNLVVTGVYLTYLISQQVYYRGFESYYRLNTAIGLFDEVVGVKDSAFELMEKSDLYPIWILLGITVVFLVVYILFQRKLLSFKVRLISKLLACIGIMPIQNGSTAFDSLVDEVKNSTDLFELYKSDYYVYETMSDVSLFVDKFGLATLGYKDLIDYFNDKNETETYTTEIETFLNEKDSVIQTNEYTGIFEGKNILFIQAESFNDFALDEDLTPTLCMLRDEGINIKDFETPALSGSTSDSEFMANTSLIPDSDGEPVCYKYVNNTYPVTLAKLFHDNGYTTLAVHNNYGSYYNRTNIFETLGYDNFYDCTDLGLTDASSDSDVMETLKYIVADADYPLMVYWITYSGHQPYSYDSVGVDEDDVEKILKKYPDLEEKYVSYLAKNMDLDRSIKALLEQAEYTGTLDDLVIVFFGDHIVKGIELNSNTQYFEETGLSYSAEFNDTDLFIYNHGMTSAEYSKVSTLLDMLPTIANMYDFDYDEKQVLGRDIFDEDYDGYFFCNYGVISTDNYYYDMLEDSFSYTNGYDLEKAQDEVAYYQHLREISKYILQTNYFAGAKVGE